MFKTKFQRLFAALVIVALIVGSAGAVVSAAPTSQQVRATTVEGEIDSFNASVDNKIWLGLQTEPNSQTTTVTIEWNRFDSENIGFYLLDEAGLRDVLSGARDVRQANLARSETRPNTPTNIQSASFKSTGTSYTVVVFNDTPQPGSFTLSATNGVIVSDNPAVTDPNASATEDQTDGGETTGEDVTAPAPTATQPVTPTVATTVATTATTTTTAPAATVAPQSTKLVANEVEGELPTQDDQHYLGLTPDAPDANITLSLTFEPQDNGDLARRLNFWVLDQEGFKRYQQTGERLSTIAIAAGSTNVDTAANERMANFTASGSGDYTVLVYNSSTVPATYRLVSTNAMLVDDSMQTLTAQTQISATATTTPTVPAASTAPTAGATTPARPASSASAAGGTYTVQAGDTLATIAADVYGDFRFYEQLCAFNNIANCDVIEIGDVIQLPAADAIGAVSTSGSAAPQTATATTTATTAITGTQSITGTAAITDTGTMTDTNEAETDIIDTLSASGNYKNLLAALEAAGLVDALRADGPFTLFAPTDAAFAAFEETAPGVVGELLNDPTNQLTQILLYHVVNGVHTSGDITNGQVLTTLQGQPLTLSVSGGTVGVNSATVSSPDNLATNGVVHGIDNVLLVPTE